MFTLPHLLYLVLFEMLKERTRVRSFLRLSMSESWASGSEPIQFIFWWGLHSFSFIFTKEMQSLFCYSFILQIIFCSRSLKRPKKKKQ